MMDRVDSILSGLMNSTYVGTMVPNIDSEFHINLACAQTFSAIYEYTSATMCTRVIIRDNLAIAGHTLMRKIVWAMISGDASVVLASTQIEFKSGFAACASLSLAAPPQYLVAVLVAAEFCPILEFPLYRLQQPRPAIGKLPTVNTPKKENMINSATSTPPPAPAACPASTYKTSSWSPPIVSACRRDTARSGAEVPYALLPERFQDPEPLPSSYRYEDKEYILESSYGAQPNNDGQAAGSPFEDKVGLGQPTENPLFANIVAPPDSTPESKHPVKIYIHGGFLQFGSPHGLKGQAQYVSAERSEVWVNIGYRLSAFGFLACDEPRVAGNFGFKDQWLALLWVRDNIEQFGGTILYFCGRIYAHSRFWGAFGTPAAAPRFPPSEGENAPFQSAVLQSNAILTVPKTPRELRPQFQALCHALGLESSSPDILTTLRDSSRLPASKITHVIETDALGVEHGTFRGCLDDSWLSTTPDPMIWQRSGDFARALKAKGVRSIVVGDLTEEWYLYSIAHPVRTVRDVRHNADRYYPAEVVERLLGMYRALPDDAPEDEVKRLFGELMSDGQVHLPVRLLARDLMAAGFPVVRYEIRWTPEQLRPFGYVTHGTDRALWALRIPNLEPQQAEVARKWLDAIDAEVKQVEEHGNGRDLQEVLALNEDRTIGWKPDERWNELMRLRAALPSEA
ncbi:predicted protein [Postia placenta Mad-698-R]|nr:predicted protein [Postia placenta Mad-698-R]